MPQGHEYGASVSRSVPVCSPAFASTKLYCLVTETHRCEKLAQSFYAVVPGWNSNPRPLDRESDALPQHHGATQKCGYSVQVRWTSVQAIDVNFFQDLTHQKSLKSVNIWQRYLKNKKVDVFWDTVYINLSALIY